ncbi:hypothetical protein [Sphingomonas endolithica]|uniref:hypothetical protein n=1 Tax=Sphingomonas endolithica TaxID=2972485 RepID=UPI0021AFF00E|nr:hypothetical protein [Sphingomonas sp. ZFBP2030]
MTTYPLSEPATLSRTAKGGSETEIVARGSLSDCADIVADWSTEERALVRIDVDDMALRYGPEEVEELLAFLREESAGLSNQEISEIADPDR